MPREDLHSNVVPDSKRLASRRERGGNVVPISPYDNTSNAYKKETPKRAEASFGFYLSLALLVFATVFFLALYDMAVKHGRASSNGSTKDPTIES